MNDNQPPQLVSYPLARDSAQHIANILAHADGKRTLERLLSELALLPAYEVVPQDNGMMALSRLGGEGTLLLIPSASFIPMMADTILRFMLPKALHVALTPDIGESDIADLLAGGGV
ncbi:hypothetical protein MTBLM1_70156 [Rhodospirillaceae bacterium LM-1]|nr:hypothetical protein MTBLM1_70156 [Rhodospirillaceae bacterium LM-1]